MYILGIDPGLTGACAVFTDKGEFVEVFDIPVMQTGGKQSFVKNVVNASGLHDQLAGMGCMSGLAAYVETTSSMPGQGVSSMFSMGYTAGTITAVLACLGIPYTMVRPQEWKKAAGLIKSEKGQSRALAIQRFPAAAKALGRVKDHNRAEAILIAAYGATKGARG